MDVACDPDIYPCINGGTQVNRDKRDCYDKASCEATCVCKSDDDGTSIIPSKSTSTPTIFFISSPTPSPTSLPSSTTSPTHRISLTVPQQTNENHLNSPSPTLSPHYSLKENTSPSDIGADGVFLNHFNLILIGGIVGLSFVICGGCMFVFYFKGKEAYKTHVNTTSQRLELEPISTHSRNNTVPTTKVLSLSCTEFNIPASPVSSPHPHNPVKKLTSVKTRAHTIAMPEEITNTPGYPKHIMGISHKTRRRTYDGPEGDHPESKDDEDSGEFTIPTLPRESNENTHSHNHGHIIIPRSPSYLNSPAINHMVNFSNLSINRIPSFQFGGHSINKHSISTGPTHSEWNHTRTMTHDGDNDTNATFPCRTNTPGFNSTGTIIIREDQRMHTTDNKTRFVSAAKTIVAVLRMLDSTSNTTK